MGFGDFFKGAGKALEVIGDVAGSAMQEGCKAVSKATGIQEIEKVGELAKLSTANTGKILGSVVDGLGQTTEGMINNDDALVRQGLGQIGTTTKNTAVGIGQGILATGSMVVTSVEGVIEGDYDKAKNAAKNVGVVVAAGVIGLGIIEGVDLLESAETPTPVDIHSVDPHYVNDYVKADGTQVDGDWRDGDGNTSVNLDKEHGGGYLQSNPDGILSNNLKG